MPADRARRAAAKPRAAKAGTVLPDARVRVASFPPQVGAGCRLLVLGTVPSLRSLEMRQSYAHPHNLFWPFMGELYGAGPELPYADRIARLHAAGVGIWDVLKHCERPGSLDSSILAESEVANDIPGLLDAYPTIAAIALNGGKARQVFERRIAPEIRRGILFDAYPVDVVRSMRDASALDVWPQWELIDEPLVERVHETGGRIIAWTVNDEATAANLVALGVDGLCGDDVRVFSKLP